MNKKENDPPGNKPLNIKVKPRHAVHIGDLKGDFNSGCSVIDVGFPNVFYVEIGEIHVKNFYTAWLSVQAKFREQGTPETDVKWKTCVERFQMMPDPHSDAGAEEYFTISRRHMQCELTNIISLRFILRQPSPMWKDYKIEDIACYKTSVTAQADFTLPTWMTEGNKRQIGKLKRTYSLQDLSKSDLTQKGIHSSVHSLIQSVQQIKTAPILSRYSNDCLIIWPQDNMHVHDVPKKPGDIKGICSMDKLSTHLQQMWATADLVDNFAPTTSAGRYDVDGSYEINLLSYT